MGAQFVEARLDDLSLRTLIKENEQIKEINIVRRKGVGITTYWDGVVGYSYSARLKKDALRECVRRSVGIARSSGKVARLKMDFERKAARKAALTLKCKKHPRDVPLEDKKEMVDIATDTAKEKGENVSSVLGLYGELSGNKFITNSDDSEICWETVVIDLAVSVTCKDGSGNLMDAADGAGGSFGLERFSKKGKTPEDFGNNAAEWAREKMKAKKAPAGEFRALCDNHLSGVLAHESLGHLSEADFILSGESPLKDKIGERVGSEHVTIIDEGVVNKEMEGFFLPYDDQGTKTQKTLILDKGILESYLHTRATASKLQGQLTGNARAVNFTFTPIPRMKNTYFTPGDMTEEEALETLGTGIYAIRTAGGQANADGSFLFKAVRGYWVENGEKKYPLKDVTLTGNILNFLVNAEGATEDLEIRSGYFGGCGKGGQWPLPVGLGGPKMLFSKVRFGGEMQ
jgi:TldD protein